MLVGLTAQLGQRWTGILMIALSLQACTSWRLAPAGPAQALGEARPDKARLVLRDGRQVVVRQPEVRGDSLVSVLPGDTVGFAMNQIDGIELRRFDAGKTVGLVSLIFMLPAAICAAGGCQFGPDFGSAY